MKKSLVLLLSLACASCGTFYMDTADLLREQNTQALKRLAPGMDKGTVTQIMGTEPSKSLFMWIDNPYRTETLKGANGHTYDVLYYYTDLKERDDKITDDELTPVIFEAGKLVGWGYDTLNRLTKK